ncbi:hypothetical protein GOP47_0023336 [Adiantum capillus-veneris]|uniref:Uncharacterized protein n=1 Tax=Adiantum capillus-veneris TaxID=13818 RepID=A0A9D4U3C4_ADICA|nr:hypothetical protein GOP47_0023336 [Adiantum capillus-veneris]
MRLRGQLCRLGQKSRNKPAKEHASRGVESGGCGGAVSCFDDEGDDEMLLRGKSSWCRLSQMEERKGWHRVWGRKHSRSLREVLRA